MLSFSKLAPQISCSSFLVTVEGSTATIRIWVVDAAVVARLKEGWGAWKAKIFATVHMPNKTRIGVAVVVVDTNSAVADKVKSTNCIMLVLGWFNEN